MPSPKKSVSPKKKTVSKPKSSPKKTVSRPKSSSKKSSVPSKPKLTDTHKAIAAASLLALLGGGALAYKNRAAIHGKASGAYNKVIASPSEAKKWLEAQPQKIRDSYNTLKMKMKMPAFFGGKTAIVKDSGLSGGEINQMDKVSDVATGKTDIASV
jgi:hypothetical protein